MPSQSAAATLRSRYVEQTASDLEENRRQQQELHEKIKSLQQDEMLLVDILNLTERFQAPSHNASLPEQAQDEPALAPAAETKSSPDSRTTQRATPAASVRNGQESAKTSAKGKSRQPLLGDIFTALLSESGEPRPAKELRDELLQRYPDRTCTPQVVRNTLESLVAKGRIRRHKQKRSVMYSLVSSTGQ
ncbi:hypothetical protein [Streptomyces sp. ISID311]|uniref:hypothetical protein n=1 Tax=Streptomyces sp. ISID311 TaxID=2601673 RepID=UPI0011BD43C9|nr:hypothetical protein [Streptomyces sp. ISID311]TXC99892.1 hypothetical protein FS847_01095 [Streptomyces sp. ISID311]